MSHSKCKNLPTSLHLFKNFENNLKIIMDYISILGTGSKVELM